MSKSPRILAIVGMPGSGKSAAAKFFQDQSVPVLRFGDETDRGLEEAHLPKTEVHERAYREAIRKELGMAAMAIKIEPRVDEMIASGAPCIVLDGLYSWEEYEYLKSRFPSLELVCIWAPPALRHARLAARPVRPLTSEEAISRDRAEIVNLHKGGPIAACDYLLINDRDEQSFRTQLSTLYDSQKNV